MPVTTRGVSGNSVSTTTNNNGRTVGSASHINEKNQSVNVGSTKDANRGGDLRSGGKNYFDNSSNGPWQNSSYSTAPTNRNTPGLNSSYSTAPTNRNTPGLNSSYNTASPTRNNNGGRNGSGANGNAPKTGGELPPVPSTPQWAFQPSPYDQSPYGVPGGPGPGPASQYEVNLPTQPWMLNPMGQPPQQIPQAPQQQQGPQYNQQWAPPYPQYNQQWAPQRMPNSGGPLQTQTPVGAPPLLPPTHNWLPTAMSGGAVPVGQNTAPPMGALGNGWKF